ncbi:hypothetical protein G5C51_08980 [Streptomyces sp. A7024]|uniref:DUF2812 domain-containing protein n=1 Tax=Streptomyces coryli TaxID=1128680 RepID=A0A6G4TY45_9ACTN|nr:hypothetical protein [Streptomyces coryli]NGN64038.1 hypothetical protein [Streptomyces coryli]
MTGGRGTERYLDALGDGLEERGMPAERRAATVADLTAYLEETGAEPEEEFGPVDEFAAQLAGEGDAAAGPPAGAEEWRWSAGASADERLLNEYGEQGWELHRVDPLGRFISRRDAEQPQRWEYRRELVLGDRPQLAARLAPDGWEGCGVWATYAYFKRPRAASEGPAAQLAAVPPAPGRKYFVTWRLYAAVGVIAALVLALGLYEGLSEGDAGEGLAGAAGAAVGGLVGAVSVLGLFVAYAAWQNRRRPPES